MLRRRRPVITIIFGSICALAVFLSFKHYFGDDVKENKGKKLVIRKRRDHIDLAIHDSFFVHQFDQIPDREHEKDDSAQHDFVNIFQRRSRPEAPCVPFQTWRGTIKICTHDPKQDKMISAFVHSFATWEQNFLNATGDVLTRYPDMTFVDLGCNIGAYTLFAASLGNRVVSVDAFDGNLALLAESLKLDSLESNVTLVHNAISDKHENVTLELNTHNVGGSYVKSLRDIGPPPQNVVGSIVMDDLIPLIKYRDVFVKMDIEGTELRALQAAKQFLQVLNVKFILMEWVLHKNNPSALEIIKIMTNNGFLPFWDHQQLLPLRVNSYVYWPENVFWIKR